MHQFTTIGNYDPSLTMDKLADSHWLPQSVSCTCTCYLRQKKLPSKLTFWQLIVLNKWHFSISFHYEGSFCLGEWSYSVGFRDDTRLISFANFEAHFSVCMESVLYKWWRWYNDVMIIIIHEIFKRYKMTCYLIMCCWQCNKLWNQW